MSVVVAIETDDCAYMACDSAISSDQGMSLTDKPKIQQILVGGDAQVLVGITGYWQLRARVEYALRRRLSRLDPPRFSSGSADEWLNEVFIWNLRDVVREGGKAKTVEGIETIKSTEFLVCVNGEVFQISDDYCVMRIPKTGWAIGCGCQYALGCLHGLGESIGPSDRVTKAVEAACEYSWGCRPPVFFTTMEKRKL